MQIDLPPELLELRAFLPDLVSVAREKQPYASVLVTQLNGMFVLRSQSGDRTSPNPRPPGIRISLWNGATFHHIATNRVGDRDYLVSIVREASESIQPVDGPSPPKTSPLDRHFASEYREDVVGIDPAEKQALCQRVFDDLMGFDDRIVNAEVFYRDEQEFRLFADSERLLSSEVRNVALTMNVVASDGPKQTSNHDGVCGTGWESVQIGKESIDRIASDAIELFGAERIAPGEYRVILDPQLTGTLAHESFGHGCELDVMNRGAARSQSYIGKSVGSALVNIRDFAGMPGRHGSLFFSDDGVLAEKPVVLVKDGIMQPTVMSDLFSYTSYSSRLPGLELSANGRLEAYDRPIYVRMTNTYFEPLPKSAGGKSRDEMMAEIDDGVLLEGSISGMEDPLGWGIQIQAQRGREIKKGKLTGRIYNRVGLSGYVPDVLQSVDAVGTELVVDKPAYCGKGRKELVRVSMGGPFLRCQMKLG